MAAITVTENAAEEIGRIIDEQELESGTGIRFGVKGGGCSGFSYNISFETREADGDLVFEDRGVRIFVDPKSILYVSDTMIDYEKGLSGRGFQFKNPNAAGTCGCGESFSV